MAQLTINLGVLEFPCRYTVLEEQIDLSECSILRFWKSKVTPDVAEQVRASIK